MALSACHCRVQVCNRQCQVFDERNIMHGIVSLSLTSDKASLLLPLLSVGGLKEERKKDRLFSLHSYKYDMDNMRQVVDYGI